MEEQKPVFLQSSKLDGSGGSQPVDADQASSWNEKDILWIHLDVQEPTAYQWLVNDSGVDVAATDALLAGETRPRSFSTDHGFLVVLRAVNTNPAEDPEDMVSVRVWVERNRVISTQRRALLSVVDVDAALRKGKGPKTTGMLLVAIIERVADRIGAFVDKIEDRLTDAEESLAGADHTEFRKTLSELRRQTAAVRRFLAPQRDALDRMYRQPGPWLTELEATSLREEADRITRYLEDLDLARERTIVLQEEFLSAIAQEQNSRMYVLSVVAAVFLPLTFVTGLLGMNVGGLPGLENPVGFWWSVAIMIGSGLALYFFFKQKKWI